jgi:V/A-type H+-transporting ATPase subunit C
MQTSYIYSASRLNTLATFLLSKTDIERLMVTAPGTELQSALKETYLAPYILNATEDTIPAAIEQTLIEAKQLIHRIAPKGNMFRVLWVQYDIHNLRVFVKAQAKGLSFEQCSAFTSDRGSYDPTVLFESVQKGELNRLTAQWQEVFDEAVRLVVAGELDKVDGVLDQAFFAAVKSITDGESDLFLKKYVRGVIDIYNIKSRLRAVTYPQVTFTPVFITGGTFAQSELDSKEQVFAALEKLDGQGFWRTAIEYYQETGNTTRIDARADEYLLTLAKESSFDMFSSASLVLYYLQCRQSAANVRTIVVGKNSGMKEEDIRANLRMAYVNE